MTSKVVLILGRFTPARMEVLQALRAELRRRNYVPMLFDFDKPASKDFTSTVVTLAQMSRFVIADLTDSRAVPYEVAAVVAAVRVPLQPIISVADRESEMFHDLGLNGSVLPMYRYNGLGELLADVERRVIRPAEGAATAIRSRLSSLSDQNAL
jgi:hypothetical protein